MRVPFKMEESFKYASVNGTDSLPKIPAAPKSLRDSLFGDSLKWRDLTPEQRKERRTKIIDEADSVRRERAESVAKVAVRQLGHVHAVRHAVQRHRACRRSYAV